MPHCIRFHKLVMYRILILVNLQIITCSYLEATANYQKPRLERNNIVNKGVWVRNKDKDKLFEKTSLGDVVFRPSSLDADRVVQSNFDAFANNVMEESPFVSAYVERARRSTDQMRKRHSRKSLKSKKLRYSTEIATNSKITKRKPTLDPSDYKIAILPNNNTKDYKEEKNTTSTEVSTKIDNKNDGMNAIAFDNKIKNSSEGAQTKNRDVDVVPKRSRKHNYGIDNAEPLDFVDDYNVTYNNSKINRDIIHKNDRVWHQNAPIPDTHVYEIVPKDKTNKAVSERGLIKVISMLTKTFKKIMKQHNEVKLIYDRFNTMNDEFVKQVSDINTKFQDFDSKYLDITLFNEKLKALDDKLMKEEEIIKTKHKEMDNNIAEFENQQKNFLAQQKQFYTIQKLMLTQNEKIHLKQSIIAKTQSEISLRQNNFARILKKTKQLFTDKKMTETKRNETKDNENTSSTVISTSPPLKVETIKLNLFSIPTKNKLSNQDELIIKEKDQKPIDDLVYKYYFNNTFIDNLMKSKVLNHFASNTNNVEIARSAKNKRNQDKTILIPINPKAIKSRVRRWLNSIKKPKAFKTSKDFASKLNDPFSMMAKSFCNEIGQNTNAQTLSWCVEKALRRLRSMDNKLFPQPVTVLTERTQTLKKLQYTTESPKSTLQPHAPSTIWYTSADKVSLAPVSTTMYDVSNPTIFFPDNEELESNLKQYDLTPDTEGNVYYDSSLHLSDFETMG